MVLQDLKSRFLANFKQNFLSEDPYQQLSGPQRGQETVLGQHSLNKGRNKVQFQQILRSRFEPGLKTAPTKISEFDIEVCYCRVWL